MRELSRGSPSFTKTLLSYHCSSFALQRRPLKNIPQCFNPERCQLTSPGAIGIPRARKTFEPRNKTVPASRARAMSDANEVKGAGRGCTAAVRRGTSCTTRGQPRLPGCQLLPRPLYPEGRYSEELARFESRGDAAGI